MAPPPSRHLRQRRGVFVAELFTQRAAIAREEGKFAPTNGWVKARLRDGSGMVQGMFKDGLMMLDDS